MLSTFESNGSICCSIHKITDFLLEIFKCYLQLRIYLFHLTFIINDQLNLWFCFLITGCSSSTIKGNPRTQHCLIHQSCNAIVDSLSSVRYHVVIEISPREFARRRARRAPPCRLRRAAGNHYCFTS